MKKFIIVLLVMTFAVSLSFAQVTFTGDASADFSEPGTIWAMDCNGEGEMKISNQMINAGVLSGWDLYRAGFNYDRSNDVLYIGIDNNGRIAGDADGDGDPGDETYLQNNKYDIADLGDGEFIAIWFDTDNSGGDNGYDVICGVAIEDDYTDYGVFEAEDHWGDVEDAFGDPIGSASGSSLHASPSASEPDFECTITNFSQLPEFNFDPLTDEISFGIYVMDGSTEDGVVGSDKLISSWTTITFTAPTQGGGGGFDDSIDHIYPLDLYVMEGVPLQVEDGDPVILFGPPFSTNPPGWPYWRVSRWNSELQTYERYQEDNYPYQTGGDPPDQEPGVGFWVVQDVDDPNAEVTVQGSFYEEGEIVTQPLQKAWEPSPEWLNGRRGLTQVANPFHLPVDIEDIWIQVADGSEDPIDWDDAVDDEIICGYAVTWDIYNLQYITNDEDGTLEVWDGFWVEQYDTEEEYVIGFECPADDGMDSPVKDITTGQQSPTPTDEYESWSFSIGVIASSIGLYDCSNYVGISPQSDGAWDQLDAPEFAPQTADTGYVHLYFPHTDWTERAGNYSIDFRSGPFTNYRDWDFNVRCWDYEGEIEIAWDGIHRLYPQYSAELLSGTGEVVVEDMLAVDSYLISISAGEILSYKLRITGYGNSVGTNDFPPGDFTLSEAYPNPFNPVTALKMNLPAAAQVKVELFDVTGRLVSEISNEMMNAGIQTISLDLSRQASGIYFVRVETDKLGAELRKIILIK